MHFEVKRGRTSYGFLHFAIIQLSCLCFAPLLCSASVNTDITKWYPRAPLGEVQHSHDVHAATATTGPEEEGWHCIMESIQPWLVRALMFSPFPPLYFSCPDVMLITVLFFSASFSLLLLCNAYNASETMIALRFSVCLVYLFFFLPWVLWWLLPLKCFKFFRSLYMKRNKGHVLTLCAHPCSANTYSLNEKENLKKMKSQQDPESDSFTLEWELKW